MPTSSSSSWTVPSSPPRPCSATKATSGRSARQAVDEVGADVDRQHVVAEPRQRVLDARAGAQRDRALQRRPALEHRDLHEASRRRSGTTFSRLGASGAGVSAGQRAVERDLLGDDLADPPHALADVVVAHAGEVQPHLRAAAPVEVGGAAGDERDVLAQRPRQQVGRVDVVGQLGPDEQAALRRRPGRLARQELLQRGEHDVAPAPVDPAQLVEVLAPVAVLEVGRDEVLVQRRGAQVGGLLAEVQALEDRRRAPRPSRAAGRPRGSSRTCRRRSRSGRRRASTASAAARPRSAAARTGCPRGSRAPARWRSARARLRRSSGIVTPPGFWKFGIV